MVNVGCCYINYIIVLWQTVVNGKSCVLPKKITAQSGGLFVIAFYLLQLSGSFSDHGSKSSRKSRFLSSMCLGISVKRCSK